ncbi:nucleotidyltransferase-like protein [Paenibacillaceae bacterium WGS1546]|uniref:nucleotidyltransferase-like protein n=1 Tax=Cohnella sp. WGS1546 TaxID=3366810 RepID=UPI00372D1719
MARTDARANVLEQLSMEQGVIGLLLVDKPSTNALWNERVDRLGLVVKERPAAGDDIEHWLWDDERIRVKRVSRDQLESRIVGSSGRGMTHWLLQGEIVFEKDRYLTNLKARLMEWSPLIRDRKLLSEFSHFVRSYSLAKQDLRDGQVLDAYSNVLASLHNWAHIVLVEEGMHPELTVWEQLRRVNPGIYKLFEELTTSGETLEQRVQLVLLACEFTILNKLETSCSLLIRVIESRAEPWTPSELLHHPELAGLALELSVLLFKLANRGCVREIAKPSARPVNGLFELKYTSAKAPKIG